MQSTFNSTFSVLPAVVKLDDPSTVLGLVAALAVGYFWYCQRRCNERYPGGPFPLPILGNLHQVIAAGDLQKFLNKYSRIYGNVFSVKLGGETRYVVSGYAATYNLLVKNAAITSSRTLKALPDHYKDIPTGFMWASYPDWKTMRTFALKVFREEGMGKSSFEPKIKEELNYFIEEFIEPNLGEPIDLRRSSTFATVNVILNLMAGTRVDYKDQLVDNFSRDSEDVMKADMKSSITKNVPLIQYLPGDRLGEGKGARAWGRSLEMVDSWINHAKARLEDESLTNFIHKALIQQHSDKKKGHANSLFNDENLKVSCLMLLGGGMEPMAAMLRWLLLFMIQHEDVQENVQQEIDQHLGNKEVTMKDKMALSYTDAVMWETQRLASVIPVLLPRSLERDFEIEGKLIPAGSELMFNMSSIMHDEDVFPDSMNFNPDRYLGDNAEFLKSRTISFSLGPRTCLGESLARVELFLFFTNLLQKFKLRNPEKQVLSTEPVVGIVCSPKPFQIIFEKRQS